VFFDVEKKTLEKRAKMEKKFSDLLHGSKKGRIFAPSKGKDTAKGRSLKLKV